MPAVMMLSSSHLIQFSNRPMAEPVKVSFCPSM
jgi:hypothetical protein